MLRHLLSSSFQVRFSYHLYSTVFATYSTLSLLYVTI
nr:MAG TPA: hypothetical protein [Crassvirales sp.]